MSLAHLNQLPQNQAPGPANGPADEASAPGTASTLAPSASAAADAAISTTTMTVPASTPSLSVVRVRPSGWYFPAPSDQTLLMAAQSADITLPSSCRNGTCRSCLCKLESGRIRYLIEWPGVSQEEREEGYFLPCVSVAETDLTITQPQAIKINVT